MTDDPRTPEVAERELLAASAYVDGVADAAERALVESSPRLLAWVDGHRVVQASIADVPPVSADVRERSIAAALAAVGEPERAAEHDSVADVPAADSSATPPTLAAPVASLAARRERRFSGRTLLGAAAAVIAMLAIGGAVLTNTLRDDDATSGARTATSATSEKTTAAPSAAAEPVGGAASETQVASDASAPDPAVAAAPASTIGSIDAAAQAGGAAESDASPFASQTAGAPAGETAPTIAAAALPVPIADREALATFANEALAARAAGAPPDIDAAASACAGGDLQVVGQALYGAAGTPVYVVIDTAQGLAEAITLDCDEVLASTDL